MGGNKVSVSYRSYILTYKYNKFSQDDINLIPVSVSYRSYILTYFSGYDDLIAPSVDVSDSYRSYILTYWDQASQQACYLGFRLLSELYSHLSTLKSE